jgi:plasmid stabilization system protein ParE
MQIRWSPAASEDLFHIVEFIRRENAPAAQRVAETIYEHVGSLSSSPIWVGKDVWKGRGKCRAVASLHRRISRDSRRG